MSTLSAGVPALELSGLRKAFGGRAAVDGLDLRVEKGEMFALVGPDGAGKTTTIRALCGLLVPDAGRASVAGFDSVAQRGELKKRIGYLSQRFSLYGDLSVDENIEFFAEVNGVRNYGKRRDELLAFTRLEPFRARLAGRLSGGMKQKLALACTLIHEPEVLFLDEPTTGVDPVSRREFWTILSELLSGGLTVFMATPYLDEAERCGRVGLLDAGRFLRVDTPGALRASYGASLVELVCPRPRKAAALLRGAGLEVQLFGDRLNLSAADPAAAEAAARRVLSAAGLPPSSSRPVHPSLENVFISLLSSR